VVMLHDALCTGCGTELEWVDSDERLVIER
jgi:hypothetical protein